MDDLVSTLALPSRPPNILVVAFIDLGVFQRFLKIRMKKISFKQ